MNKQEKKDIVHLFNVEDAKKYGMNCAVLLYNISYWCDKNQANKKHYYDGHYWTYNSTKAFQALFPYLSQDQIKRCLKKLKDEGAILVGNYNKVKYDRTNWYSTPFHLAISPNGFGAVAKPIPDINTNVNTEDALPVFFPKTLPPVSAELESIAMGAPELTDPPTDPKTGRKPTTPSGWARAKRAAAGKPPITQLITPKQAAFIKRVQLIPYFKEKINEHHKTGYFEHPDDIADLEKENSKLTQMLKAFFSRCDQNLEKGKQVIDFFAGEYGGWCGWKPSICFRKETVQDYETSLIVKKKTKREFWE